MTAVRWQQIKGVFCKAPKRNSMSGFTLMELLIVVAIAGTIITIGALEYRSLMEASSLRMAAQTVLGDVKMARLMAVTKNRQVKISVHESVPYGYTVSYTLNGNLVERTVNLENIGSRLRIETPATGDIVAFNSNGTASSTRIDVGQTGNPVRKRITINLIGRAYLHDI